MKKLAVIALAAIGLALAGCQTTKPIVVDQTIVRVISPPANLLNCPQLRNLPNPETLTNQQVADTIELLWKNNKTCGINMNAIKSYIAKAKANK